MLNKMVYTHWYHLSFILKNNKEAIPLGFFFFLFMMLTQNQVKELKGRQVVFSSKVGCRCRYGKHILTGWTDLDIGKTSGDTTDLITLAVQLLNVSEQKGTEHKSLVKLLYVCSDSEATSAIKKEQWSKQNTRCSSKTCGHDLLFAPIMLSFYTMCVSQHSNLGLLGLFTRPVSEGPLLFF